MVDNVIRDADARMNKALEALRQEFSRLRTGRASTSLLDHIQVECYGSKMPLNQTANIAVQDARTLVVTPWDKNMVTPVEKAIREAALGLNPATAGMVIRIPLPPLTEERRKELTKFVRHETENARVAMRNVRRDALQHLKDMVKAKKITEDEEKRAHDRVQKLTDDHIVKAEELTAKKEKEIMEV
ncbi:MAG: ribosome recycling factor [Gammaproteobacteria bacterium]|nr:ribosome recycling factor [Gammaproteobacteria bacterium]MCG3146377.1 Ribosome-recycling factor [Gammaproteobacteria bacterium]